MRRNLISLLVAGSMAWASVGAAWAQSGGAGTSGGAASGGAASSAPAAAAAPAAAPVAAGPAAGPMAVVASRPLLYIGGAIVVGGIVCAIVCGGSGTQGTSTTTTH